MTPSHRARPTSAPARSGRDRAEAAELRAQLSTLDARQKKIVGGVLATMFKQPERVRDREWIAEQFTEVALLAGEWEDGDRAHGVVEEVRAYARENIDPVLNACYALFTAVADELDGAEPTERTPENAMLRALAYF